MKKYIVYYSVTFKNGMIRENSMEIYAWSGIQAREFCQFKAYCKPNVERVVITGATLTRGGYLVA